MKRKGSYTATSNKKPKLERQGGVTGASLQAQINTLKRTEEMKVQDQAAAGNLALVGAYATAENCVTRLTQGPGYFERIGSKVVVTGVFLKFFLRTRTAELTEATNVRVLLFIDKQPSSGVATCPALSTLYPPNGVLSNNVGSLVNCNTFWPARKRYRILMDKVVTINPQTVSDYDPVTGNSTAYFPYTRMVKKFFPLKDLPVMYNNTTGVADSVATNNIWLWFGQTITGSGVGCTVDYVTRLYYKDA